MNWGFNEFDGDDINRARWRPRWLRVFQEITFHIHKSLQTSISSVFLNHSNIYIAAAVQFMQQVIKHLKSIEMQKILEKVTNCPVLSFHSCWIGFEKNKCVKLEKVSCWTRTRHWLVCVGSPREHNSNWYSNVSLAQ